MKNKSTNTLPKVVLRFKVCSWCQCDRWDFDKCDTYDYGIIEVFTNKIYMWFCGEYDQPYGCDSEYDGVGWVVIDESGTNVLFSLTSLQFHYGST